MTTVHEPHDTFLEHLRKKRERKEVDAKRSIVEASRDLPENEQLAPEKPSTPYKPRVPQGAWMAFLSETWAGVLVVGVGGWLGYELFLADFGWLQHLVGVIWGLGLWAMLGATIVSPLRRWRRQVASDRDHRQNCANIEAKFENDTDRWINSRPLTVIKNSTNKVALLRAYAKPAGSLYLGVSKLAKALVMAPRDYALLLLAPARRGKTLRLVIPAILAHSGPVIVVSTKPDAYEATYPTRARTGRVWSFDPTESLPLAGTVQARYSPLLACTSWKNCLLTAKAMVGASPVGGEGKGSGMDPYWPLSAELFLAPLLMAATTHPSCNMVNVRQWASGDNDLTPALILREVAKRRGRHARGATIALENLASMASLEKRQLDGVLGTVRAVLNVYNYEEVIDTCTAPNFDVEKFVRSTDTVYITASSRLQEAVAPLIAAFLDHVQTAVYDYNRESSFMASDRPSLLLIVDEAANAAPVKALPRFVSEGGSQGLQVVMCLQSLAQAEIPWPIQGKSLIEYFSAVMATGGITNETTLRALSVLTGDEYRPYVSRSYSTSASTTESHQWNEAWSGGFFFGQNSSSHGGGNSVTHGYSNGHTVTEQKQRRMTEADIASLPFGDAFLYSMGQWRIIDMVGVGNPTWNAILASVEDPAIGVEPEPVAVDLLGYELPSIKELRRRYENERDADTPES